MKRMHPKPSACGFAAGGLHFRISFLFPFLSSFLLTSPLSAPFHKYGDVCKVDGAHAEGGGRGAPPPPRRGSAESRDEQERDGAP